MSGMDLDAMRGRWQAANRRTDAALRLDIDATRKALAARTRTAFGRHSVWLLLSLLGGGLVLAALGAFFVRHFFEWRYALMSGGLLALVGAEFVVDLRQWRALSRLDLGGPLLQVRGTIEALRARRLAMAKWIALSSLLLWWPALLVAFAALTGVDLLSRIPPNVVWLNFALGLAWIPLGWLLFRWLAKRYAGSPGFQRFLVETAGRSWQQAEAAFAAGEQFEQQVASDAWTPDAEAIELPVALERPLRTLRWRLNAGIAVFAALVVGTGFFNAMHGGQAAYLVAGVALNLLWISQMVGSIVHRRAAMRPQPGVSLATWRAGLAAVAAGRLRVARILAVLLPILLAPATQLLLDVELAWLVAGAILASALLAWQHARSASFAAGFGDALSLGALPATRHLPPPAD